MAASTNLYNTLSGMCWICSATHSTFKHMTIEVRSRTKTNETFAHNVISMGKKLPSFWGPPEHITSLLLCPDWLHSCDQGVGADIAGQLLVEVAQKCPGNNFKERLSHLWKDIQMLYVEFQTPYKFQTLNPEGLNKGEKKQRPTYTQGAGSTSQIYGATTPCSHKQIFGHEFCSQPCLLQACQIFGTGI